jgi:Zn-dependent protease with chaperone function
MYTNLIFFLVAIFLFSFATVSEAPLLPAWQSLALTALSYYLFARLAGRLFARPSASHSSGYFSTEKKLSVLALAFFAGVVYLCEPKYYLSLAGMGDALPSLVNVAGLVLFVFYLALMWRAGRSNYERIFGRKQTTSSFIAGNIKANLPIVLPWVILSLLYDIVVLLPLPWLQSAFASEWGDLFFFAAFLVFVIIFFPPLVRRLWGCREFPEGPLKEHLVRFCRQQQFTARIFLWPLFEGRVITAGVMGIVPGLRYILITPALVETMTLAELDAVMAHEIGHVKKRHLLLYILLIGCFSLLAGVLLEPLLYVFLSMQMVTGLVVSSGISVEKIITLVGGVPFIVFLIIYFRFVFGYFIRNFERQADLFSLQTIGDAEAMVSAFEKIAMLSGNIREEKNWHHFGIGERIDCLRRAERDPGLIGRHTKKVRYSLLAYLAVIGLTVFMVQLVPMQQLQKKYQENFAETVLFHKARQEPERAVWQRMIGDLMINKKMEEKALEAYEKAFSLEPSNTEIMNNFAWLLLTSRNPALRDPARAFTLARSAATLLEKGYVLDTLATAYWANGFPEQAIETEYRAMEIDPGQRRYYQSQILKFSSETYEESLRNLENGLDAMGLDAKALE